MDIKEKQFDIVVVGNAGIDTNVYLPGKDIIFSNEANFTENIDYVGQAGGYSARGFAQLGYKTAYLGFLGNDFWGDFVKSEFTKDGIEINGIFEDPWGTARSINLMYADGRRKNFYDGKSHMVSMPDLSICDSILSRCKLAHFNIPNWARHLLPLAKKHNITISCDIQDVINLNDHYRQDFIEQADILFLSAVNLQDIPGLIKQLIRQKSERIVIVGMGAEGCAAGSADGIHFFPAIQLPGIPVIDTNGAGDGLAVGFLSSYILDGYNFFDSIFRAQIVARFTCGIRASTTQLIQKSILNQYFQEKPE
jgi:acarbose 7IV-phosphotransferase